MPKKSQKKSSERVTGILGVGLDGNDGHRRITEADSITLIGGSQETHERMQDTAIRFGEELQKRGKRLEEVPLRDVVKMFRDAEERTR